MKPNGKIKLALLSMMTLASSYALAGTYTETFRPQFHYTPAKNWMNDPNGLVYYGGKYHLFYQYNPNGMTWGDMSWGHAVSTDTVHWTEMPIALNVEKYAPGQVTQMFWSGSAVVDSNNTSGLGTTTNPPMVAIYTSYYPQALTLANGTSVQAGTQAQSIAYSLDQGTTWTQYSGDPIIQLPPSPYQDQFQNFRDPKVFWYAPEKKWVMVAALAALHKVVLYSSKDLKQWTFMSEFGPANESIGAWECPDLFPLPVDGNTSNIKWVLVVNINPGSITAGSGAQYFLGQFDDTQFVADANNVYDSLPPAGSTVFQNFEGSSYSALGWTATGALAGQAPARETIPGMEGNQLADTYGTGDSSVSTLTSPPFTITTSYINFLVSGGYHPYDPATYGTSMDTETAVNLLINGKVVQSTTGSNGIELVWRSWDVSGYNGQVAQIQIVDNNTGTTGWGHILVDDIVFSDVSKQEANWIDYGPDFYAVNSWNGLSGGRRLSIGWMNNWNYANTIPTTPWRSAMSVPREFALKTINSQVRLVQRPVADLLGLRGSSIYTQTTNTSLFSSNMVVPVDNTKGEALDISTKFKPGTASQFGMKVRVGANGEETVVGYDVKTHTVFVDRSKSGQINFDPTFTGRYSAPLLPSVDGSIALRVLVDWSSVEVFGGSGEAVLTSQIFPAPTSDGVAVFANGGTAVLQSINISSMNSSWPNQ
ncbi:glycoside hydrolase family 32 protein [Beijerinckia indica]|uniref:Levanase n=1 Tax=Beijerinckia indica subsp. indica (strain ATCC 9039 / DSM 1715 / NCIMB 8712) TaxID=395963 RepID=B2IK27_BEII9|nr:glycoside hydrolase family 32 protein [Beijerinckia indica]ACB94959.1 Levanase [Beijerinckia indica subsp. indica ATCC 9039]